jgi:hypothetical protein
MLSSLQLAGWITAVIIIFYYVIYVMYSMYSTGRGDTKTFIHPKIDFSEVFTVCGNTFILYFSLVLFW